MKKLLLLLLGMQLYALSYSQFVYKIKADSLLVTNDSCSAELNLENSTKSVLGFLYNKGNGRTEFRSGLVRLNDSVYIIGNDTLLLPATSILWKLTGNNSIDPVQHYIGTNDSVPLIFRTFGVRRMALSGDGTFSLAPDDTTSKPQFKMFPNGNFVASARSNYNDSSTLYKNGIRYHSRLGFLEIGTSNFIDTSMSNTHGIYQTSGLIVNTDDPNHIYGTVSGSIIAAYNVNLASGKQIISSLVVGGDYFNLNSFKHVIAGGDYHNVSGSVNGSLIIGNSQRILKKDSNTGWFGFYNRNFATSFGCLTSGMVNFFGSVSQLTAGHYLVNRSFAATALGNGNVDFTSLPYNDFDSIITTNVQNIQPNYLLFSLGNSSTKAAQIRSNAISVLYNGRTQINTTGYSTALSESQVTPKAALEIVSNNSGILIPRLTTTQRDSISGGDLHNGLLIFNSSSNNFQYYNGSIWMSLADSSTGSSGGPNLSVQNLADGSTITWDATNGINGVVTLAGTGRTLSITNPVAGQTYTIRIIQDGTGGRTISTWPTNSKWPNGIPPTLSSMPGRYDLVVFYYDGTNFYGTYQPNFQ
jgi:hypothetical protein